MKMHYWNVYKAGGDKVCSLRATCVSKAVKNYMDDNFPGIEYKFKVCGKAQASIVFESNYTIFSDFIVVCG